MVHTSIHYLYRLFIRVAGGFGVNSSRLRMDNFHASVTELVRVMFQSVSAISMFTYIYLNMAVEWGRL